MKNFHKPSRSALIAPILVSTNANETRLIIGTDGHLDHLLFPILTNKENIGLAIQISTQNILHWNNNLLPANVMQGCNIFYGNKASVNPFYIT